MADRRVALQVRVKSSVKQRLEAAAERRYTSQARLAEFAISDLLDRLDAEDMPAVARRRRLALLEEA